MKQKILNLIKEKFLFIALILGFFFSQGVFAASNFNTGANDLPLRVGNATQSSGTLNWGTSLSGVNPNDGLKFQVYYHNASNTSANNAKVTLKLTPSGSSSNFQAESQISADGFNTYSSNANISLNKSQQINLKNTAKWYHNYDGSNYQIDTVQVSVSGNTATFNLGNIASGYAPHDGYIVFEADVSGSTPASSNNFNTGANDLPLRVGNATQSSGTLNWGTSLSGVNPNDGLKFQVYYHNASNTSANNAKVTLKLTPSGSSSNFQAESQISADGFNTYSSNANISLNKSQQINLKNTAKWYHNYDGSNYQIDTINVNVSGNIVTFNLGNIASGYAPHDGYIVFEADVSGSTPASSNNFNTGALDHPLKIGNATQNPGSSIWQTSLTNINPKDILKFQVYYHNASNTSANNAKVTLKLTPSGSSSNFQAESQISADGFNTYSSNANISLNKSQRINFKNKAIWYHNYDGSNYQIDTINVNVSGNIVTFNLGNVAPGYAPHDGYIIFEAEVDGDTSTPSQIQAHAGNDQIVKSGDFVRLNGSQSTGSNLSYAWVCSSGIYLDNYNIVNPSFIAPEVTSQKSYTCTLTVSSSLGHSNDNVSITVNPKTTASNVVSGTVSGEILSVTENKNGSVVLNAKINECTYGNCIPRFIWGEDTGVKNQTDWLKSFQKNDQFSHPLINLKKGKTYYAGLEIQMGSQKFKTQTANLIRFTTKPDAPSSFIAKLSNNTNVDLSWRLGEGGTKILIKRSINTCPTLGDTSSKTIYLGTGQTFADSSLEPNTNYCYKAWMIAQDDIYSDPVEIIIGTKAKTTSTGTTIINTQVPAVKTGTEIKKNISLENSLRNISLNEIVFKKSTNASAGDEIEFLIEVKNTGSAALENIIIKNLINNDLTLKNVFVNNVSHSLDIIDYAFVKELKKDETFKINFTAVLKEYDNAGVLAVVTEVSADDISPIIETVNIQKETISMGIEDDAVKASFFSTIIAGKWFPWSILALIVLLLLIVYFSFKEERERK